jgi:small GTP-binding protein
MKESKKSYSIKYIIIGDSGVGKSNILLRYSKDKFDKNHKATLGIEFMNKKVNFKGTNYTIQIWDTAGQENYKSITRGYYKSSACAFIVYDITNLKTFKNINNWIKDCVNLAPKNILLVLIGNKSDLEENREVDYDLGKNFADENNMIFFETSALSGNNIINAFNSSIQVIHNLILNNNFSEEELSNNGIRIEKNNSNDIQINKMKMGNKNNNIDCCKM